MGLQRILFRFAKEGEGRFLSHRDLMRLFERALRRAGLPVRMTQGFNPHPRLSVLAALALGVEADNEALEVEFDPPVPPAEALERLARQAPQGVVLHAAEELPQGCRPRIESLAYEVHLPEGLALAASDVERFLARDAPAVQRGIGPQERVLDARSAVLAASLEGRVLKLELRAGDGGPKVAEVIGALLGVPPAELPRFRLRRTNVRLAFNPSTSRNQCSELPQGQPKCNV